jgi:16S rRNA (cytidine1402-2'-O)-methyltransferase
VRGKSGAGRAAGASGGILYVIATPIGNLGDVTLRALEVLRAVPLVAAEDTRLARRLWARHGLSTRLVSYHARNAARREPELLAHLRGGADLALVTDAGTPLVSDPGEGIVQAWAAEGGEVVALPGASAVLVAVAASGIAGPRWGFEGFLPRRGKERRARLARIAADDRATVIFEASARTAGTLADLVDACGPDRPAAICRELTKLHEEIVRGPLAALAATVADHPPKGEVTLVVSGSSVEGSAPGRGQSASPGEGEAKAGDLEAALAELERLVADGRPRSQAARIVAARTGLPRRALFAAKRPIEGRAPET